MTIIVETPLSRRLDRLTGDICALLHNTNPEAVARAQRWIAHVLADAESRRRWEFLQKRAAVLLAAGEDVVELKGDLAKVSAVYAARSAGSLYNPPVGAAGRPGWMIGFRATRLRKRTLAWIEERRQAALASASPNAGAPSDYALEFTATGTRVHLWPAPGASRAQTFTADAGTDLLTASAHGLATGGRFRLSSGGTLPTPLEAGASYYAIRVSADTIKAAVSPAAALAGTAIDLTDAGTGTHTIETALTPFVALYSAPIDLETLPPLWETLILCGVLGTFGRHFDRDALTASPQEFERRYEQMLRRAGVEHWDIERVERMEDDFATEAQTAASDSATATSLTVPASATGVGAVTIELGDYPLTVQ